MFVDNSAIAETAVGSNYTGLTTQDTPSTLGSHTFESRNNGSNYHNITAMGIVSPIHTSSHYQTFETPFLHELVGGDRNMEQTNLVVTPDGKTWDDVTRDTSYIGNIVVSATTDAETDYSAYVILDEWRGGSGNDTDMFNKDFAIAYDRLICLKDGQYKAQAQGRTSANGEHTVWQVNGNSVFVAYSNLTDMMFNIQAVMTLKRGDYLQLQGEFGVSNSNYNQFSIIRL